MTLRQALEVAQGAISWWRSDGDPNEDVGDLKGAAARLARFLERWDDLEELARGRIVKEKLSYHGEAIECLVCHGKGTRAGYKRDTGNEPVKHAEGCLVALILGEDT